MMEMVDVTGSAASPKPDPQVAEVTRNVREEMYSTCSFPNISFRELLDGHKLPHREC